MRTLLRKTLKKLKRAYYTRRVERRCGHYDGPLYINHRSNVTSFTTLGANVHMNGLSIRGDGKVHIKDNFHCGEECLIITATHNYHGEALPYDTTSILKDVTIEENVWLGTRVIVLGGVTIGEGAIIQAGSVVVKDIPPYAIAGGHPAQVFAHRDKAHYDRLKSEGKIQRYGKYRIAS